MLLEKFVPSMAKAADQYPGIPMIQCMTAKDANIQTAYPASFTHIPVPPASACRRYVPPCFESMSPSMIFARRVPPIFAPFGLFVSPS